MTSVLLLTNRPGFASSWRAACETEGLTTQPLAPEHMASALAKGMALVIDADDESLQGDALLAHVAFARAHGAIVAVVLPSDPGDDERYDLLLELCGGLVGCDASDQARIVTGVRRRSEPERAGRFEFLTPAPGGRALLAVLGDASISVADPPERGDGQPTVSIQSILLADDRRSARVSWADGATLELTASELARTSGGHPKTNGASAGLGDVDGVRLGQRLRALRIQAGLTQAELARRTGIHRPNIARVEAGRHTPSLETLARLAAAIGVSTTRVLAD